MLVITFGGKKKESLQLRLWNLNICIEKVEAKCGLEEMTLVMTPLPLASMFFNVCLHFRFALIGGNLTAQSMGSHRGIGGGIQLPETYWLLTLLLFPAPPPERRGELARSLVFRGCGICAR